MAIDTEGKRRSVAGALFVVMPIADAAVDAADRAHAGGFYAGLVYEELPEPLPVTARGRMVVNTGSLLIR